jgi:hypothetical protein
MQKSAIRILGTVLLAALISAPVARVVQADDVVTFVIKRQEEKKRTRWSLSDWLDTRDKMRMQDLWLALHSPSPYEFSLGGGYQYLITDSTGLQHAWFVQAAAYVTIFGLSGEWDAGMGPGGSLVQRWLAQFNLRVFGMHMQGTNLTLNVAFRQQFEGASVFRQPTVGAAITLYFAKPFGIDGLFRYHFDSTPALGTSIGGMRVEGGTFLEFGMLRFLGNFFWEPEWRNGAAGGSRVDRMGIQLGTRVYL